MQLHDSRVSYIFMSINQWELIGMSAVKGIMKFHCGDRWVTRGKAGKSQQLINQMVSPLLPRRKRQSQQSAQSLT